MKNAETHISSLTSIEGALRRRLDEALTSIVGLKANDPHYAFSSVVDALAAVSEAFSRLATLVNTMLESEGVDQYVTVTTEIWTYKSLTQGQGGAGMLLRSLGEIQEILDKRCAAHPVTPSDSSTKEN